MSSNGKVFDAEAIKRLGAPTTEEEEWANMVQDYEERLKSPEMRKEMEDFSALILCVYSVFLQRGSPTDLPRVAMLNDRLLYTALSITHMLGTYGREQYNGKFRERVLQALDVLMPDNNKADFKEFITKQLNITVYQFELLKQLIAEIEDGSEKGKASK